jgi:hypothetical protein
VLSADRGGGVRLSVRAEADSLRPLLEEFFTGRGWRVHAQGPMRLDVERGSLARTILLGALAGRRFHVRARLELDEIPGGTRIRYRWGATVGRALGGAVGWSRAAKLHAETAEALAEHLRDQGILGEVAPER